MCSKTEKFKNSEARQKAVILVYYNSYYAMKKSVEDKAIFISSYKYLLDSKRQIEDIDFANSIASVSLHAFFL